MDNGHDFSDDSGSDNGHEVFSVTIFTCAISPCASNLNETQIKNIVTGGKKTGNFIIVALNFQKQRNNNWLNIDHFFNNDLETENCAIEIKCQKTGNIENKPRFDGAKNGQVGKSSQKTHHNVNGIENGPGNGNGVKHGGKDVLADPEMESFEIDGERFNGKNGHKAGVGVDTENW